MDISGKRILITGGAGSFGQFLCTYFLDLEAEQIILVDLNFQNLDVVINGSNKVKKLICDLTDADAVKEMIREIYIEGHIDVLINNAGFIHSEPLINLLNKDTPTHSLDNWSKTISLNLTTCFNISSNVAHYMAKKRIGGVIINVSSISAKGNLGQTAYSAAKAGVESMTKVWSKELGIFKIRVACVAPGFIDTPSTRESLSEAVIDKWKKSVALNRLGELKNVGEAVKFIIQNDYFNGSVVSVDGGLSI